MGPTFVSNQGYSPGAEILQDICFDYKKSRYGCFFINLSTKYSSLPENFFVISEKTWGHYQAWGKF